MRKFISIVMVSSLLGGCAMQPPHYEPCESIASEISGGAEESWDSALQGCIRGRVSRSWLDAFIRPYSPTWHRDEVLVQWHVVKPHDLVSIRDGMGMGMVVRGFALPSPDRRQCDIYVPEPRYGNDRNVHVLGHEVLHCFRGAWHGSHPITLPKSRKADMDSVVQKYIVVLRQQGLPLPGWAEQLEVK